MCNVHFCTAIQNIVLHCTAAHNDAVIDAVYSIALPCAMYSIALQCMEGIVAHDVAVIDADQCQEKMVAAT